MSRPVKSPWAVVLAAGDGARLRPLTRLLYEQDLPKQFAVIEGGRSLLQSTLDRLAARFPAERTVVVGKSQETVARHQLRDFAGVEIVAQPRNLGTGPGLLLPLARVRAREPGARVAVFPSDHHVPSPSDCSGRERSGTPSSASGGSRSSGKKRACTCRARHGSSISTRSTPGN